MNLFLFIIEHVWNDRMSLNQTQSENAIIVIIDECISGIVLYFCRRINKVFFTNLYLELVAAVVDSGFFQMLWALLNSHRTTQWKQQKALSSFHIAWIVLVAPFVTVIIMISLYEQVQFFLS